MVKWAEVEREEVEFVNRVTNECLGRMLPVRDTNQPGALIQHLANHSTYHRGQVALLMMRQLAAEPLATDFAMFLMEATTREQTHSSLPKA